MGLLGATAKAAALTGLSNIVENVKETVRYEFQVYKRKVVKDLASLLLFVMAASFLAVALVFAFVEYLNWPRALAFGAMGLLILVVALILKLVK